MLFSYDRSHEDYLVQRVSLPLGAGAPVASLILTDAGTGGRLLLCGVRIRRQCRLPRNSPGFFTVT